MKAVTDKRIMADFAKSKSTGMVIRSYEKGGSYLCYALISDTVILPYTQKSIVSFVLFLDKIIMIQCFSDLLGYEMITICFLMVQDPEIKVAAAAIPRFTVDEILCVLTYSYPEGSVAWLEYVFLDTVLSDQPPSLIEPITKSVS